MAIINQTGGVFLFNSVSELLARIIVLFTAIAVHEYAHGYVAYKLGDPTAKYSGRLSLNPMAHLDPIGAVCMVFFGFGWAKPVPINPMYFRDRKRDSALTALAGPLSNICLAFIFSVITALYTTFVFSAFPNFVTGFIYTVFVQLAFVNISFAIFNLIPFPPLDGSKILGAFLSNENYMKLLQYERFGFPILILLSVSGILSRILTIFISPVYSAWISATNAFITLLS